MNFVYPSYRPSLQRSPSDPLPVNESRPSSNLFYPYVSDSRSSHKIGRFTIEPTNSKPVQKIGRFTVTPANSKPVQKIGRFTVTPAAKGGYKKSRSKRTRKRRSITKKSYR
jgi:hypothetical protein